MRRRRTSAYTDCKSGSLLRTLRSKCGRTLGSAEGRRAASTSLRMRESRKGSRKTSYSDQKTAGIELEFALGDLKVSGLVLGLDIRCKSLTPT